MGFSFFSPVRLDLFVAERFYLGVPKGTMVVITYGILARCLFEMGTS